MTEFWLNKYYEMTSGHIEVVEFKCEGFTFLFDIAAESSQTYKRGIMKEARVVAAHGITAKNSLLRNTSRMKGFIGGFESIPGYAGYDKGHFISHKIGGILDQNLFPQKREVNRGWSEEGKRYRKVERFCEKNEGIFMFSRPLYNNPSWIPYSIEIGYLTKEMVFDVEKVLN